MGSSPFIISDHMLIALECRAESLAGPRHLHFLRLGFTSDCPSKVPTLPTLSQLKHLRLDPCNLITDVGPIFSLPLETLTLTCAGSRCKLAEGLHRFVGNYATLTQVILLRWDFESLLSEIWPTILKNSKIKCVEIANVANFPPDGVDKLQKDIVQTRGDNAIRVVLDGALIWVTPQQ